VSVTVIPVHREHGVSLHSHWHEWSSYEFNFDSHSYKHKHM